MTTWIKELCVNTATFNSWLGILLYWLPAVICTVGYTARTIRELRVDINERRDTRNYEPRVTLGLISGRLLWPVIPVLNLALLVFDLFTIFDLVDLIETVLRMPLVPPRRKQGEER